MPFSASTSLGINHHQILRILSLTLLRIRPFYGRLRISLLPGCAPVKENAILHEWDPCIFSILTEVTGAIHYKDLVDSVSMQEQVDEITGTSR